MIFPTRVNGIPCQCKVLDYRPYLPMRIHGSGWGDADPPEEEYFEFELLDQKGYVAHWLSDYITPIVEKELLKEFLKLRCEQIYA